MTAAPGMSAVQPATVGDALAEGTRRLVAAGVESARLDALLLLSEVTGLAKAALLARPERPLRAATAARYAALVARRAAREPLAYLLGRREFYGRAFLVTPAVLIPRPETELLVELALAYLRAAGRPAGWAADVGTGSGAIAVTLAAECPGLRVLATDRSPAALAVARANAAHHGVTDRVALVATDLLLGVRGPFALVAANLPYVPSAVIDTLMPEVARYEPRAALDGGPDGLELNRRLLAQAAARLARPGLLLLELDEGQGELLRAEARRWLPDADVAVVRDLAGHERVLRVERR